MIVDLLNAVDYGGAAIAARRLHHALLEAGMESRFWTSVLSESTRRLPGYHLVDWTRDVNSSLGRWLARWRQQVGRAVTRIRKRRIKRGRPSGLDLFSLAETGYATPFDPRSYDSDVIHLHWVSGWLDYPSFFASIPDDFPIVWTFHDMHPISGGCHYSGGCDAWARECRACPQLGGARELDESNRGFRLKLASIADKNLHVVAPSHWLADLARKSPLMAAARSVRVIHYGLDVEQFSPADKRDSRKSLDIAPNRPVIGFGAPSLDDRRKGFRELLAALRRLGSSRSPQQAEPLCLVFGQGKLPEPDPAVPEMRSVGFIDSPQRQRAVLSACDVFVLPSLEDNSPQTGIEAMACGTPVVAFDAGGIPDYVRPGETGLLARLGDSDHLAAQIGTMLADDALRRRFGTASRQWIEREFEAGEQALKYRTLYDEIRSSARPARARAA